MFPLAFAKPGEEVIIDRILGGFGLQRRLSEMGLYPGERVKVVSSNNGPVVVEVKGTRLGIGFGMAKKIIVRRAW